MTGQSKVFTAIRIGKGVTGITFVHLVKAMIARLS